MQTPSITKELVAYLEAAFPIELPEGPCEAPHEINVQIGRRQVVDHLRGVLAHQEEDTFNV